MRAGVDCEICHSKSSVYKCPKCRTPYCSVACFSVHKGVCSAVEEVGKASQGSKADAARGLLPARRRRAGPVVDDDPLYVVSAEALERVNGLPSVQEVMKELKRRKRGDGGDDGDDDSPPSVMATGQLGNAAQAEHQSRVRALADVVEAIGSREYLEDQRKAMLLYLENDEAVAEWCDEILRQVGARDEQGRNVL